MLHITVTFIDSCGTCHSRYVLYIIVFYFNVVGLDGTGNPTELQTLCLVFEFLQAVCFYFEKYAKKLCL